jgi:DNA-damage-inducible protein D
METGVAVFKGIEIRKTIHNNEWWFVVEDVVLALIDSSDPKQYIQRMKQRDPELGKGWVQIVHTLWIDTSGGKQKMNYANTEGTFRIIESIPFPVFPAHAGISRRYQFTDLIFEVASNTGAEGNAIQTCQS